MRREQTAGTPRPVIRKYPVVIAVEGDIIECPVDRAIFHGDITRCIRNNTETCYANSAAPRIALLRCHYKS